MTPSFVAMSGNSACRLVPAPGRLSREIRPPRACTPFVGAGSGPGCGSGRMWSNLLTAFQNKTPLIVTGVRPPAGPVFLSLPLDDWDKPCAAPAVVRTVATRVAPEAVALAEALNAPVWAAPASAPVTGPDPRTRLS